MRRLIIGALDTFLEVVAVLILVIGAIGGWSASGPVGAILGFIGAFIICVISMGILFVIMEMNENIAEVRAQLERAESNGWSSSVTPQITASSAAKRPVKSSIAFQPSTLASLSEDELQQVIDDGSLVSVYRYAKLMSQDPDEIISRLQARSLVGVEHNGAWFLAPPS
jgi:hypothetical protein